MIRSSETSAPAPQSAATVGSHEWKCGLMMIAGITCVPVALVALAKLLIG